MDTVLALVYLSVLATFLYLLYAVWRVLREEEGTERMREIAGYIREGAGAYMRKQYSLIALVVVAVAAVLLLLLNARVALAYLVGASCSALTGFVGLHTAIRSNARTANVARKEGMGKALSLAFRGGSVLGMSVVGVGLLGVTLLSLLYGGTDPGRMVEAMKDVIGFSFGASTVALFARVGGGIYTKSADIGADLVGKVEKGIPEDDPRNPGVIADNVGDNVGDVAGMGADLFESYVGSLISAMALGALLYTTEERVLLPLLISSLGLLSSLVACFSVRGDPSRALTRSSLLATLLTLLLSLFACRWLLGGGWEGPFVAVVSGLLVGVVVGETSDYFTSKDRRPARRVAEAAQAGAALDILEGFSMGWFSTFVPVVSIAVAGLISYLAAGFYGVALSAVGMLSVAGVIVAADAYGPITDNAAGIAEQAGLPDRVRKITDRLDSVGNTMKSICKGFAIGSAALTAIAFFFTLTQLDEFQDYAAGAGGLDSVLSLVNAKTFAGLLIGVSVPALFTALVVLAVSGGAFRLVDEIRRQFREIPGLMRGKAKPDYARCVSMATGNALRNLLLPGILAILFPPVILLVMGPEALVGFLAGAIGSGLLLGMFQGNVGNTWDNAKKYVEEGHLGGKGSPTHAAAVTGDTVGDPMKDASGPSINIFLKLMAVSALVFSPAILPHLPLL
jgi:K(+)-stimulated pyrophosphate-energized sodium pump